MRCLDLNIPPGNEEMARFVPFYSVLLSIERLIDVRLCREILNCCVRNTEEAEKSARAAGSDEPSGRGAKKGVWSMIEESSLAKSVNNSDENKVNTFLPMCGYVITMHQSEAEILVLARECKIQLEGILSRTTSSSSTSSTITLNESEIQVTQRSKNLQPTLVTLIQSTTDPAKMEEMLELNDSLATLLSALLPNSPESSEFGQDPLNMESNGAQPPLSREASSTNSLGLENGHGNGPPSNTEETNDKKDDSDPEEEEEPLTPRVDKGKGRATEAASPVLEKLIMAGSFSITDSDDEDEERRREAEEQLLELQGHGEGDEMLPMVSPTDRYDHILPILGKLLIFSSSDLVAGSKKRERSSGKDKLC